MALTLNTALKYKTLTGVFKGQNEPIEIGRQATNQRPNYIGIYKGEDSVIINAYFDPTASPALAKANEKYGQINNIGYVQVGRFLINGFPLPLDIHQKNTLYPNTSAWHSQFLPNYTWVDICEKNSIDRLLNYPYYALWPLKDEADYSLDKSSIYPQEFGGITNYPWPIAPDKSYLCAYMTSEADMGSADMAASITGERLKKILDESPLDDFNYQSIDRIAIVKKELPDIMQMLIWLSSLNPQVVPPLHLPTPPIQYISFDQSRMYIQYRSEEPPKGKKIKSDQMIALFNDPDNRLKTRCVQISDYILQLQEDTAPSLIDLSKLDEEIRTKTQREIVWPSGLSLTSRTDLGLAGKTMTMSYRFVVYPCAINNKTEGDLLTGVDILKFEGFTWQVNRKYKEDTGWDEMLPGTIDKCSWADSLYFEQELKKFYQKRTTNMNIPVNFPFLVF